MRPTVASFLVAPFLVGVVSGPAEAAASTLVLSSQPGDYIGGGATLTFDSTDGSFTARRNFGNGVSLSFQTPAMDHWFFLDFAAPGDAPLAPGRYAGATRFPFQDAGAPGLSVSGDGRGCNTLVGSFDVKQIVYGSQDEIVAFWAAFEQHCEGGIPAVFGEIRFNADQGLMVMAPATETVSVGDSLTLDVTTVNDGTGSVALSAVTIPPGASFVDDGDGTGTLTWQPSAGQIGVHTIVLEGHTEEGDSATSVTQITVTGATAPSEEPAPGEPSAAASYFPLRPGTVWDYVIDGTGRLRVRVLPGVVPVGGVPTRVLDSEGIRQYYTSDTDGIRLHRLVSPNVPGLGRLTITFTPPMVMAAGTMSIGETVVSNGTVEAVARPGRLHLPYHAQFTVEGPVQVTVPAGAFQALRISGFLNVDGSAEFLTLDLADDIGQVRSLGGAQEELAATNSHHHDLAVLKITAPARVTLSARAPSRAVVVKVQIENRSPYPVRIENVAMLEALVTLDVASLGPCPSPVATLKAGAIQRRLPLELRSRQKLTVPYDVTFSCANDSARTTPRDPDHSDYQYVARVSHLALDGRADVHPDDDICPRRAAPPFPRDPFRPDVVERGCGARSPDRSMGGPVLTDIVGTP